MALSKIVADSVGSNAVTTAALSDSGVTAGSYGNTTAIPVITVDAKGRITSATTNSVSGVTGVSFTGANNTVTVSTSTTDFSANINASLNTTYSNATSYADTKAATAYSNGVTYAGTIAATAYSNAVSTASADASTKAATAYTNAVAYAASNSYVNSTFAPKAGPTFTGTAAFADVTISGNLTTSGTTTYINTTNLTVGDNIIILNADLGASAPTENAGIEINRGTSANVALRWYEASDEWQTTVDGTNYLKVATNNDVTTAYSNAITYSGNAALAYANAVTYAGTIAATAYTNATSYAATIASTAYSNATTYAATIAGTAYSNAIAYAAANSYVNTQLGLKASLSGATFSGAVSGITTLAAGNTTITGFANVTSTINSNGTIGIYNSTPYLDLYQAGTQQWKVGQLYAGSANLTFQATGATTPDKLIITSAGQFVFSNASATSVLFSANGNIGIGNTSPSHKLSVNGTAYVAGNTTLAGMLSVSGRSTLGSIYCNGYTGYKDSNATSFTMIEITGLGGSGFIFVEIDHGHAGGGMHGAYRRFAMKLNAYTDLNLVEDYEYTYGGGLGYTISRPSTDVVRIVWNGASSYASSYYTTVFIRATQAFSVSNIGMTNWG